MLNSNLVPKKSIEMAVAILGVLKSGGAFLPMDPSWPFQRRQFILEDSSCRHLVVQRQYATELLKQFNHFRHLVLASTTRQYRLKKPVNPFHIRRTTFLNRTLSQRTPRFNKGGVVKQGQSSGRCI